MPAGARYLGYGGLIPFVACAAGVYLLAGEGAVLSGRLLVGYAAIILSFMGAVHWGLAVAPGRAQPAGAPGLTRMLTISVVPALVAWAALSMAPALAVLVMAITFAALALIDRRYTLDGIAPAWYWRLRLPLTAIVVLCLLAAAPGLHA